jgi:hypothetical protein
MIGHQVGSLETIILLEDESEWVEELGGCITIAFVLDIPQSGVYIAKVVFEGCYLINWNVSTWILHGERSSFRQRVVQCVLRSSSVSLLQMMIDDQWHHLQLIPHRFERYVDLVADIVNYDASRIYDLSSHSCIGTNRPLCMISNLACSKFKSYGPDSLTLVVRKRSGTGCPWLYQSR